MNPFLLSDEQIGPYVLRPWSVFTQIAVGELASFELTEVEQMLAFVWIQSSETKEIRKLLGNGKAIEKLREFCDNFPLAFVASASEWVKRQNDLLNNNRVEIVPRPTSDDPDAPKN
jgi:hypothetical protein